MQNNDKSSMPMVISVLVIILIAIAAIFFFTGDDDSDDTSNTNTEEETTQTTGTDTNTDSQIEETQIPETTTFNLTAQNDSGQNGTVVFEEVGSQVRVTLTLSNPSANPQPAHIHSGRCPTPGAVVYPLTDVVNGTSVTALDTNFNELVNQGDLAVNVHKSSAESNVYVSCGDVVYQ
jgi:uncharacterized protein YxeA